MTREELLKYVSYDKETGIFSWNDKILFKGKSNLWRDYKYKSDKVGSAHPNGYIRIKIKQKAFFAHRLAWLYVYGEFPVKNLDHINGDKADNRICNLREATVSQNGMNRTRPKNNTSGIKGVVYEKSRNKWAARIKINTKMINLGRFDCPAAASFAYQITADKAFGEFARTF